MFIRYPDRGMTIADHSAAIFRQYGRNEKNLSVVSVGGPSDETDELLSHIGGEAMAQWKLSRERRQRMWMALQLLVVSGVIRPAHVDLPYLGAEGNAVVPSEATPG